MGKFVFNTTVSVKADERLANESIRAIFSGFTFNRCSISFTKGALNSFSVGELSAPTLPDGKEYVLSVKSDGLAVVGKDYGGLVKGVMALLNKLEFCGEELFIRECDEQDDFTIKNRMIHLCVFPETTLFSLRRTIRLCGVLGYTHVVLEFWGTLRYDCEDALSWKGHSFSKTELKPVIDELYELGMELIPMFNHLGHASGSRLMSGKHVVLDQKPSLFSLFTPDGWSWDIDNEKTLSLLKAVRAELYELCGKCNYFHLGLDEAYMYAHSPELRAKLPAFLQRLTREVAGEGARPMLWMDMLLPDESGTTECCKCTTAESKTVLSALDASSVLVDWQYGLKAAPIKSSLYLVDKGFDIVGAPWFDYDNCKAHVDTCAQYGLHGVMLTTWHTLNLYTPSILHFARLCGAKKAPWSSISGDHEETATLLRKLSASLTPDDDYLDSGWCGNQIDTDIR